MAINVPVTLRTGGGYPLTFTQADANFSGLAAGVASAGLQIDAITASIGPGVLTFVDTAADIRALLKTGPATAMSRGYYAPGDGGISFYRYDSTDTVSADNGVTVFVASDGGRWKLMVMPYGLTAAQCGMRGDGSTDDSAAFTTALNFCVSLRKHLVLSADANYFCTSDVPVPVGNFCPDIIGQGWNTTFIEFSGASIVNGLYYDGTLSYPYAGKLSDVCVICSSAAVRCITAYGTNGLNLSNTQIRSAQGTGLAINSSIASRLDNVWVVGCGSSTQGQIEIYGSTTPYITRLRISGSNAGTIAGLRIDSTNDVTIIGGAIESTGIPLQIGSKSGGTACVGGEVLGTDMENPGQHYVEMGAGWTGAAGGAALDWIFDAVNGYTSGATDVRYGMKLYNTSGVTTRRCNWALIGASLVTEHWLDGTGNSNVRIADAPHSAFGNSRPWVTINGAIAKDASPLVDWQQNNINVSRGTPTRSGATPSVSLYAVQGGVNDLIYLSNASATNVTNLTDCIKGQTVTIMALDANSTLVHAAGGAGQFKFKSGANTTLQAGFGYQFVYDGATLQQVS